LSIEGSKVVVTGGAGFIGSHLVENLTQLGCSIIVIDDMSKGQLGNIRTSSDQGRVKVFREDIREYRMIRRVTRDADYVFHAAAIIEARNPSIDESAFHEVNVTGTLNLLRASCGTGVRRFINLSSAAVYGKSLSMPIREDSLTNPISFYGASKLSGEHYCRVFTAVHDVETVSLRLFNVYGPRQGHGPYAGVITGFVNRLLRNKRPTILGDGMQTRDFVHVSDVVKAMIKAATSKQNVKGKAFNVGSGKSITIKSLARRLAEICRKEDLVPQYEPPRPGDIRHSCADVKLASSYLGFRSAVPLDKGLEDYVSLVDGKD
jgi:UDP-glucose 4-epimerase